MQRRIFLAASAGALAAGAPVGLAGASPGPMSPRVPDNLTARLKVLDSYLTNSDLFPLSDWPPSGSALALRRDPGRAFDARSVQVLSSDGRPLGYLPPASAQVLAALMDHGTRAGAVAGERGRLSVYIAAPG